MEKILNQLRATQDAAMRVKTDCETKVFDLEKQSLEQSKHLSEQFQQLSVLTNATINAASRRPEIKSFLEETTKIDGADKNVSSIRATADVVKKSESSGSEEETESSSESEKVQGKKNSMYPASPSIAAKTNAFQKNDSKSSNSTKVIKVGSYQKKASSSFADSKVKTFLDHTSESTASPEKPAKKQNTQRVDVKDKKKSDKPISASESESESEESEEASTSGEASTQSENSSEA